MPIIIPTIAQATPTGSAVFAPSASASLQDKSVSLPPFEKKFQRSRITKVIFMTSAPNLKNNEAVKPKMIQNIIFIIFDENPNAIELPKIRKAVNISPMLPE